MGRAVVAFAPGRPLCHGIPMMIEPARIRAEGAALCGSKALILGRIASPWVRFAKTARAGLDAGSGRLPGGRAHDEGRCGGYRSPPSRLPLNVVISWDIVASWLRFAKFSRGCWWSASFRPDDGSRFGPRSGRVIGCGGKRGDFSKRGLPTKSRVAGTERDFEMTLAWRAAGPTRRVFLNA